MTAKVRVGGLRGYTALVRRLGGDPERLTRDCGVPEGLLDDEDALIPYRQLIFLMEHTATELAVPDFGLRLARAQDIGVLGPLAVAMQNSGTAQEALRCAATYLFVQSPALSLEIDDDVDGTRVQVNIQLSNMPHAGMRQAEDLAIGVTHGVIALLVGDRYELIRVELPHEPLCARSVYENYFGSSVLFGCQANSIIVSRATLATQLTTRSDQLRRLATTYLDVQLPSPDGLFATRVETAVRRTLGTDSCNRDSIARAMAMHPRTLQRRLEEEGETFDDIRDRVRRDRADYYLCCTNLPLAQVAGIIGYSEQAILSRSCRRWFGNTPRKVRAAHQPSRTST